MFNPFYTFKLVFPDFGIGAVPGLTEETMTTRNSALRVAADNSAGDPLPTCSQEEAVLGGNIRELSFEQLETFQRSVLTVSNCPCCDRQAHKVVRSDDDKLIALCDSALRAINNGQASGELRRPSATAEDLRDLLRAELDVRRRKRESAGKLLSALTGKPVAHLGQEKIKALAEDMRRES